MKTLITGANGMLARAAIKHCESIGDEIIALARQELDISDKKAVFDLFESERFDAVLNCAAYTNVDGAESNREICFQANAVGAENLASASRKIDCRFVTVSTNYVFDGAKSGFYTQRDTPNPQGVYAESKLEGERRAKNAYARSIVVRSGWIYGAGGTNFLSLTDKLLAEGKIVKAIGDSFGTPTYAGDLARRLRELAALDLPCVYHVTNAGEGASYAGFARKICRIRGFDESLVQEISFADLKRPAPRPQNSKLACLFSEKFGLEPLQNWEKALEDFLKLKDKA